MGDVRRGEWLQADDLIQRIFAVGLVLAPLRSHFDEEVADRAAEAMDALNGIVVDAGFATFAQRRPGPSAEDVGVDEASTDDVPLTVAGAVLDALRLAADDLHHLAAGCAVNGEEPIQLAEAEHSVRRAVVVLRDDLLQPVR